MGGFGSYFNGVKNIKMDKGISDVVTQEDKKEAIYDTIEKRGLDEAPLDYGLVKEDAMDVLLATKLDAGDSRFLQERYYERVNYYFGDADLMESKAKRYQKIAANEDGEVTRFADEHTNEYACKRIKNANAASEHFTNAANLIKNFEEENKTGRDIYEHRKAVMAERELAMRAAAVTKSKSSRHEKYLQAKASVSCIMTMLEQCENYNEMNKQKKEGADEFFMKEKAKLEARFKKEQNRLLKYAPTRDEMWEEKNASVLGEGAIRERKRRIRDEQHVNASDSEVELYSKLDLLMKAKNDTLPFERMVLRDENGAFISKGEMLKEAQNQKFREEVREKKKKNQSAFYRPERLKVPPYVVAEMVRRVMHFKLPVVPDLLSYKKDFLKWLNSDLTGNFEMLQKTIPEIEKVIEAYGGEEYIYSIPFMKFPGFDVRFMFLRDLRTVMDDVLDGKFGIKKEEDDDGNDAYVMVPPAQRKKKVSLPKEFGKKFNEVYASDRKVSKEHEGRQFGDLEFEKYYELNKDDLDVPELEPEREIDLKAEYNHYKTIRPSLSQEDFDFIHTYSKDLEITRYVHPSFTKRHIKGRMAQILLHVVHYDKNGRPMSEEDKENFKKTDKAWGTNRMAKNSRERKEFIFNQLNEIKQELENFEFPKPEMVTEEWVNNLIMAKTEDGIKKRRKVMELCIRVRGFVAMSRGSGADQWDRTLYDEFIQKNPAMEEKCAEMDALDSMIRFVAAKHGYEEPPIGKREPVHREEKQLEQRREWNKKVERMKKQANNKYLILSMKRKYDYSNGNLGNLKELEDKKNESFNAIKENNPLVNDKLIRIAMKNKEVNDCYNHPLIAKMYETLEEGYGFKMQSVGISRSMGIGLKKVHYDNNWVPLTAKDKEAHEHNVKWLETFIRIEEAKADGKPLAEDAVDQKIKKKMVLDAYEDYCSRLCSFKFPTKEEIQNGWIEKLEPDEVEEFRDLNRLDFAFSNRPEKTDFKDYEEDILKIQRRYPELDMMKKMFSQMEATMRLHNMKENGSNVFESGFLSSTRPGEYQSKKSTETRQSVEQNKGNYEYSEVDTLNQYEDSRKEYDAFMKLDANEKVFRNEHYKPVMEKYKIGWNVISLFVKSNEVNMTAKDPKLVKWMNELKKIGFTDASNLTRALGTGLRLVHYDKNGRPKTEKDRENQMLNENWVRCFYELHDIETNYEKDEVQQNTLKQIKDFHKNHLEGMMTNLWDRLKNYKYPTEQEIRDGWFEKLTTEQQEDFFDIKRLTVAFASKPEQEIMGQTEMVNAFYRDHPAFLKYVAIWQQIADLLYAYLMAKYGVKNDGFNWENGVLKEKKTNPKIEKVKALYQPMLDGQIQGYLRNLDEARQIQEQAHA